MQQRRLRPNAAAWYRKREPTFSDAIAAVRRVLWWPPDLSMSRQPGDVIEITAGFAKSSLPDSMLGRMNCGKSS
jgi:hypothetical protein